MNKIVVTASILFFSQSLISDEIICVGNSGFNKPSSIEKLAGDCTLQKNLASNETVINEHKKNVYDKLASALAVQIKQNSEDISILTSFFNSNGHDLLMNSSEVAQSCRLDSIKIIETCNGKRTGDFQDTKLAILKSKLPNNASTPFQEDQSLFGIMAGKFYSDLGMKENSNNLKCPLEGQTGSAILQSQLDDETAEKIIKLFSVTSNLENFETFPLLKIIKMTNNSELIDKFRNYAKNKPADKSAKEHIASFFFDPEYQKKLAPTIAKQCRSMNENINRFLCSDITELGSLDDDTSRSLFNKLSTTESMEDQYEVDFSDPSVLTAYGMQCIAKENRLKNPNIDKDPKFQSIDQWFSAFTNNIRREESDEIANSRVKAFCSIYTCSDSIVKNEKSCQNGGPLSSEDFIKSHGCDLVPIGTQCVGEKLKAITYLQGLEKLRKDSKDQSPTSSSLASSSSTTNATTKPNQQSIISGRLPNFAENYLGVEGSLKALGKPTTVLAITEKRQEFAENKLATNEPVYSTPTAIKKETHQQQPKNHVMAAAAVDTSNAQPVFSPTAMSQATAERPTAASPSARTEVAAVAPRAPAQRVPVADNGAESSKLREEMEKMIADIKSTKQEMTEVENNMASTSNSIAGRSTSGYRSAPVVNRAEQERLRRLEQSLDEKAQRLEQYRRELDNRNFAQSGFGSDAASGRTPSGEVQRSASAGNGAGGGGTTNGAGPSGNSGPGNSLKLTSTTNAKADGSKVSGNNYSAALIQSGVESSTLTVDELEKLSPDNLKNLGIDLSLPFTLKVNFNEKIYQVPVKSFIYKGLKILAPITEIQNKDLNNFLLKSPLFKQFINYKNEIDNQEKASN